MPWWGWMLVVAVVAAALMAVGCIVVLTMPWHPDDDGFPEEEEEWD